MLNSVLPVCLSLYNYCHFLGGKNNREHVRYESDSKLSTYQAAPTEFSRQEKPVPFCQNSHKTKKQTKKALTKIKCAALLTKKIPLAIFCLLPFCKAWWPSGMLFPVSLRASTHFIYNTQADSHRHKIRHRNVFRLSQLV